jgi:two-component system OmpR family sensor kinase
VTRTTPSIRTRLSRTVIVIALIWSLAVTAAVWYVIQHEVEELLDQTLQESAQIMFGLLSYDLRELPANADSPVSMPAPPHLERLIWQVVDSRNRTLLRSHNAPVAPLLASPTVGLADAGDAWRVYGMRLPGDRKWTLYVAQEAAEREEASVEAAQYTAGMALLISLGCALWMSYRLKRELQPVADLSQAVLLFDPLGDAADLPPVSRAELAPMHRAITSLGARLAQRVANERAFSAHAAHALRTPLAGLDAQLAVAMRESPAELLPRLTRARLAANRLQRVVTALLALFRSGNSPHWQALSLSDVVAHLSFDNLTISCEGIDQIEADPDLLAAALMNLLDNSARHQASHVSIVVSQGQNTVIQVRDNGSGIPEVKRLQLQQALDAQDYAERTGLGLMLSDMVARAHGGSLQLCRENQGCAVELHFATHHST